MLPESGSLRRGWPGTLAAALAVGIVMLLAATVVRHPPGTVDLAVTRTVQSLQWPGLDELMVATSALGLQPLATIVVVTVGVLVAFWLGWQSGLFLAAMTALANELNKLVKAWTARPRPTPDEALVRQYAEDLSFPSGHVMFHVVFFGLLAWMVWRFGRGRWRVPLLTLCGVMILLVGPSRIYLGMHWVTDVVGGYLLGGAILWLLIVVYERWIAPSAARRVARDDDVRQTVAMK